MHGIPTFIPFALAIALAAYGWWCSFRTESAMDLLGSLYQGPSGKTISYTMTKLHGILGFLFAAILLFGSVRSLLK